MTKQIYFKVSKTLLLILLISSCTVRIIAPYDPVTDEKTLDLQEKVVTKFLEWEREIPPLAEENSFYDETNATLEILILRNENIPKSQILVGMLKNVKENIRLIRNSHEAGELSSEFINQVRPDIMAQFNAIQKFQMALKKKESN